jgi:DnaJ like chaperone protein
VDPLAWLGLRDPEESHLAAVQRSVREVLPDDEAVVIRYIVIVAILLTQVAYADGSVVRSELDHLRALFRHIDRLPPDGIERVCDTLYDRVPRLSRDDLDRCVRELRSLCNGDERRQVIRLLADLARADGQIAAPERGALFGIGTDLNIPDEELEELLEAPADSDPAPPSDSPDSQSE